MDARYKRTTILRLLILICPAEAVFGVLVRTTARLTVLNIQSAEFGTTKNFYHGMSQSRGELLDLPRYLSPLK